MATEFFLLTLLRAQLAASFAILVALGVRRPVRRRLGPVLGYRLWGLLPAAVIASLMPGMAEWLNGGVVHLGAGIPATGSFLLRPITLLDVWRQAAPAFFKAWLLGALGLGLLFAAGEVNFRRKAAQGLAGPAIVGVAAPRLVVPTDFRVLYDEEERTLIRRHERTHIEENHPLANLAVGLFQIVGWFNPLAHVAAAACRLDQELACDALVLEGRSRDRRVYAATLLKAYTSEPLARTAPFTTAWSAGSLHPLEVRLKALNRKPLSVAEHVRGAVCVALAAGILVVAIWSVAPVPALTTQATAAMPGLRPPPRTGERFRSD